jgi:hypothetical protein
MPMNLIKGTSLLKWVLINAAQSFTGNTLSPSNRDRLNRPSFGEGQKAAKRQPDDKSLPKICPKTA